MSGPGGGTGRRWRGDHGWGVLSMEAAGSGGDIINTAGYYVRKRAKIPIALFNTRTRQANARKAHAWAWRTAERGEGSRGVAT